MGKSMSEEILHERYDELEFDTDRLGPGSLMLRQNHINSSRIIMCNHQFGHVVNIKNPEPPLVPTGFENVLGKYSTMRTVADSDYDVVAKLVKNEYNYILVLYDKVRKHYHAIERTELEEHSENFATRYKNGTMDSLVVGSTIKKNAVIKKSTSFDKYDNYCLGKNFNTVYLISTLVMEDAITLMNGAEKMMNTYRSYTITVPLNDNEIFLNLMGKDGNYQAFPKVGEKIKNGILCGTRNIDNSKAAYSLKDKYLKRSEDGDKIYPANGRVIDVVVYYNKDKSKLIDSKTNEQINNIYLDQSEYYKTVYKYLNDIINHAEDEGYTYSDELTIIWKEIYRHVDASAQFTDQNNNIFGNMQIVFTVMDEEELTIGSKLVGRAGNKGIVGKIVKPENSYKLADGRPIQVIVSALGVVGRLNPDQLNELSLNDLGYECVQKMKKHNDVESKFNVMMDLLKIVNSNEAKAFKKYYHDMDKDDKAKYFKNIEDKGQIYIIQDPIDNVNIMDIEKAYDLFPTKPQQIIFPDGSKSLRRVTMSKVYFLRLKQDPTDKYSVRSRGPISPVYSTPSKSNLKKKHLERFSDVAVRFGGAETDVLNLCNVPQAIADFMAENSTSFAAKEQMSELYMISPDEELVIGEFATSHKRNCEIFDSYFMVKGSRLVMIYDNEPK